ncbi:hypothetical protein GIB67_028853, partial [Kingdonia uniflora]
MVELKIEELCMENKQLDVTSSSSFSEGSFSFAIKFPSFYSPGSALVKQEEDAASNKKAKKRDVVGLQEQEVGPSIANSFSVYETLRSSWQIQRSQDSTILMSLACRSFSDIASSTGCGNFADGNFSCSTKISVLDWVVGVPWESELLDSTAEESWEESSSGDDANGFNSESNASNPVFPENSEISGFIKTLENFPDIEAISYTEKIQILAVIDLLAEISDLCSASPYASLDEPGR